MTTLLLHETLCATILFSVFCRAVKSNDKVRADVRASFFFLGIVACVGMAAPIAWGFVPDTFGLCLLAAIAGVQGVTAKHWAEGVPDRFYRPGLAPRKRRASDYERRHA